MRAWLRAARERDPALFWLRIGLGVALVALLVILIGGDPGEGVAERLAEDKPLRGVDYWRTWGWWVALGNAVLLVGMIASARRWFTHEAVPVVADLAPPSRPSRTGVLLVAAAVLAGAALAAPRLDHSFWDDEEYNVMRSIDGQYAVDHAGKVVFREASWRDTLWYYVIPNNHVLHTILSRLSVDAWRLVAQPDTHFASETAARLPAFLAGLASIVAVAALLWRLGYPVAGIVAAWLLALHPWHYRFGSEVRGYSLVMLGVSATLALAVHALHRGTWGRWAAYGLAQFLLLFTYPGLAVHVALLNGVALVCLWWLHRGTPALARQGLRWALANLLSAMVWLQLMVPNVAQLSDYHEPGGTSLGGRWLRSVGSHLFAGMPWNHGSESDPLYPELQTVVQTHPLAAQAILWMAVLAIAIGCARLAARGGVRALLLLVMIVPAPLVWGLGVWQGANLFSWYMVFALPSLVALTAIGLTTPIPPASRLRPGAALGCSAAIAVAFVAAHFWLTTPARNALLTRSYKPGRESVELARPVLDPAAPENRDTITVTYRYFNLLYYDPREEVVEDADELRAAMARADAQGAALFGNFSTLKRIERYQPEILALLRDETLFEQVARLPGFEPRFTREVYRYRGAAQID